MKRDSAGSAQAGIVRVALDVPLATLFDYRATDATEQDVGARIVVPFGRKVAVGVIMERAATSEVPTARLRAALRIPRDIPPLPAELLKLLRFCSEYYHHPLGETVFSALPTRWRRAPSVRTAQPRKAAVRDTKSDMASATAAPLPELTSEQQSAVQAIDESRGRGFVPWLLHGVTGSGKTEIYLRLIARALALGEQVLLLVPEINLTPQLEYILRARFPDTPLAALHSGLSEGERLHHWRAAQDGSAGIVLGTRLAVFTPMPRLGLILVDEEHDSSFKQAEGLRYSARDVALRRAQQRGITIVLGSATPALETYHHALSGRYRLATLSRRPLAPPPEITCLDTRGAQLIDGLSQPLLRALNTSLKRGDQSLVFINRRGYAPVLCCGSCGWTADCTRCSAKLVLHLQEKRLRCHHCGHAERLPVACPQCGNQDLQPLGQGTQRVEAALTRMLPAARILRIDRDSTRKRAAWSDMREQIQAREVDILVGTQILAKGHDFPGLNLVGVLNADSSLYSTDFRAAERLYARLTQVAGRAGRAGGADETARGQVLIQTDFPDHPLYDALRRQDYDGYARAQLAERKQAGLPPYAYQAVLRAEATRLAPVMEFLEQAARGGRRMAAGAVDIYDPVPAALARLAGLERAHLVVESRARKPLHAFLQAWRLRLPELAGHKIRWTLDIDPQDI